MTQIEFHKAHGCGNDFILIDGIRNDLTQRNLNEDAKNWCQRGFGLGADGLIIAWPSESQDIRMQIINSDGSEPEMCGNGIRCFAKFCHDTGLNQNDAIHIETLAGPIIAHITNKTAHEFQVKVDMGAPILEPEKIPVAIQDQNEMPLRNIAVQLNDTAFQFTPVSMGNPHAVIFVEDLNAIDLQRLGPISETHSYFPEKVNTEFVQLHSRTEMTMKVWERGAGATNACGTGACAIAVAGVLTDRCERDVLIHLPGGDLQIHWQESDNHLMMTGPAETVANGHLLV